MREIKFRAWDKVYKHFHEQDLIRDYIIGEFIDNPEYEVNQYTGFKDKNNREIYEEDIVEAHTFDENINKKQIGRVTYHSERHGYIFVPKELEKKNLYYPLFSIVACELIGNVYENPELLIV